MYRTIRPFRCRRVSYPLSVISAGLLVLLLYRSYREDVPVEQIPSVPEAVEPLSPASVVSGPKPPVLVDVVLDKFRPTPLTKEELQGGLPTDVDVANKRNKVREMMKFAWDSYAKHAWGANELRPVSMRSHNPEVLGPNSLGTSIVDSLDTLYIMGLNEEFQKATDWVKKNLNFRQHGFVSVFEFTIRYLGGLLSAYTFTLDQIFLQKAVELGDLLLPAFTNESGIPYSLLNLQTGERKNYGWATQHCSILSEIGTLHMEFAYLSELTGNPVYAEKVIRIRSVLIGTGRPDGLYYNFIHPITRQWCSRSVSLGGLGDSFYEYLLKEWIRSGGRDTQSRDLYDNAITAISTHDMIRRSARDNIYVADYSNGVASSKMEHLTCFAGGLFALGAKGPDDKWLSIGANVTATCHLSYNNAATKLGPEAFHFTSDVEGVAISAREKSYLLRPETVESYFYMWRITKDQRYRDWAWEAVEALDKYTRTANGYSGLQDVYVTNVRHDDVQQSYFLAETLKYLYLIFSEDSLLPLNRWVFNTEAHPFPVKTKVFLGDNIWLKKP